MAIDINIPSQVKTYANLAGFPVSGSLKTIYIAEDTNKTYRWTGTTYVEISATAASTWGAIGGTLSNQTDLQTALNAKVNSNTAITGATKTKITYDSKGLVTAGADATTADIADSLNKRYVTDANLTTLANTSGVNTGDQTLSGLGGVPTTRTISTTAPLSGGGDLSADRTLSIATANTTTTGALSSTDWNTFNGKQSALVSGTNIKTINSTSLLGSGDVAVQATLVSGTNIKTINGTTILGSGDLTISTGITIGTTAITSGTIGRILFEGTGNVVSESANLFWDNTNGRLGIGGTPGAFTLDVNGTARTKYLTIESASTYDAFQFKSNTGINGYFATDGSSVFLSTGANVSGSIIQLVNNGNFIISPVQGFIIKNGTTETARFTNTTRNFLLGTTTDAGYKLDVNGTARVKGTGTTSSTVSLSIQNSAGTGALTVKDDLNVFIGNGTTGTGNSVLDQRVPRLYTFGDGSVGHYITSTLNGGTGDTSLALVGVGTGGGWFGGIRFFTSANSATPNLAMIIDRNQSVGIGLTNSTNLTVNASAILQADSTTKGFLPPRMTTTQKNAIATPAAGLMVYDTTLNVISYYNGTMWI